MVSKAFKIVYSINEGNRNLEELMIRTTQSLIAEPDPEFYKLYFGPDSENNDGIFRVANIIKHNSFLAHYDFNPKFIKFYGAGIWILPSYFNHSCVDENVYLFFLGDLMFVRSLRPISKGDELVLSYYLIHDYEERTRSLKSVGIVCQCRLCKLNRSESQKTKLRRTQILEHYEKSIVPKLAVDSR